MANDNSQSRGPETIHVSVEIPSHLIGRSLIDGLRRSFTTNGQEEQGDEFMDQSRVLLKSHLKLIDLHTQNIIRYRYDRTLHVKDGLESHSGSQVQKFFQARKYRRLSRKTYKVVKKASDRAVDGLLMDQLAEAVRGHGAGPENNPGTGPATATTHSNPFSDSHARSTLTDVHVDDLEEVDLSTFATEDGSEAAAVIGLVRRDAPTQHINIVGTFPTEVFSEGTETPEATTALSVHREDGTSPSLVITPLPHLSPGDHRNQDAEIRTTSSIDLTEVFQNGPSG